MCLAGSAENATGTTALREIYDDWSGKSRLPTSGGRYAVVQADKAERITFDDRPLTRASGAA